MLAGVLSAATVRADQGAMTRSGPAAERTTSETVIVTGIDRSNRTVSLQNAEGEKRTVKVPPDVKLKSVDLTVSLESLSFYLAQGDLGGS